MPNPSPSKRVAGDGDLSSNRKPIQSERPHHLTGTNGKHHEPLPGPRPTQYSGHHGLAAGWIALIVIVVLIILAFVAFTLWRRRKASKAGLPPPSLNPFKRPGSPNAAQFAAAPAAGGVQGWISNKVRSFQAGRAGRGRYAAGAYEGSRGVDADEAWDTRVGQEETGYYGAKTQTSRGNPGGGYAAPGDFDDHEMDVRGASYDDLQGGGAYGRGHHRDSSDSEHERDNPFGETAERSNWNRGAGGRPISMDAASTHSTERRSMFRENM
jgi:hypothetical protein